MPLEVEGKSASVASPDAGLPKTENPSAKACDTAETCSASGEPSEWKVAILLDRRTQGGSDTNRLYKKPGQRAKVHDPVLKSRESRGSNQAQSLGQRPATRKNALRGPEQPRPNSRKAFFLLQAQNLRSTGEL